MYPTWPPEELCAMLRQRVRDPLSLLYLSPSRDCLWQNHFVPTVSTTTEEAGAMGGSCQLHWLLALQPQGLENHQQTYWQVWTLLPPVPRLGKFHCLAVGEERGTQDCRPRAHQAHQQGAVRPMEDSNTWGSQYLRILQAGRVCCCPQTPEAKKKDGTPSSQSLYSTPGWLSNLGSATSSIPACTNSGEKH